MAIRVRLGSIVVEVDTPGELFAILPGLAAQENKADPIKSLPQRRERSTLKKLYQKIEGTNQGKLLRFLQQHSDGMTDVDIRKEFTLNDNSELAGMMSGLSKNAVKAGFTFADAIIKEERKGEDKKRAYHYKLSEEMAKVVPGQLL